MTKDLDILLEGWCRSDDGPAARLVLANGQAEMIQFYDSLALTQMHLEGRPDGVKPEGWSTHLDRICGAKVHGAQPEISEADVALLVQEWQQFQLRRRALLVAAAEAQSAERDAEALRLYRMAIRDANHCLSVSHALAGHGSVEHRRTIEPELPAVLAQRAVAQGQVDVLTKRPDESVEHLKSARRELVDMLRRRYGLEHAEDHSLVQDLCRLERSIRQSFGITLTLREQLIEAVAAENYERASEIRDALRHRGPPGDGQTGAAEHPTD